MHELYENELRERTGYPLLNVTRVAKELAALNTGRTRVVVADGLPFMSQVMACRHLGITRGALVKRIESGWPGYWYADERANK